MTVGGIGGTRNKVQVVSTDPERHPVPKCLQRLNNFPAHVQEPMGAATLEGMG